MLMRNMLIPHYDDVLELEINEFVEVLIQQINVTRLNKNLEMEKDSNQCLYRTIMTKFIKRGFVEFYVYRGFILFTYKPKPPLIRLIWVTFNLSGWKYQHR